MKDLIRISRLERKAPEVKIEDLNGKLLEKNYKFYLGGKIKDILLIQVIPEWDEFKETKGRGKMAKSKEDNKIGT